jgi:hypothetical protein
MNSDADPAPAIFVRNLQDVNKNVVCVLSFEGTFTSFFKDKKSQRSQKTVGSMFSYYFCLMIE